MIDAAARPGVDATRQRILAATRTLYAERGSRGTTTREVAERAGVNEATIFRHFGTKQQLLGAMLDEYCGTSLLPALIATLEGSLEQQLHTLARHAIEVLRRKEDLLTVGLAEEYSSGGDRGLAWNAPIEALEALRSYFAGKVAAGEMRGEPIDLARCFMSLFFAFVIGRALWSHHPGFAEVEPFVRFSVELFLNGARA